MDNLFYTKPAKNFKQALPMGNSNTGVMVFGGKNNEKLLFNDSTFWSGYPEDKNNPNSKDNLEKVRQLIFDGKNLEAENISKDLLDKLDIV